MITWRQAGLLILSLTINATVQAQSDLSLNDVLESSRQHYPSIRGAIAEQQIAANETMVADGNFDTRISSEGFSRLSGFYDGTVVTNKITQPLQPFGASVFAQYKIANGDFPIYEDLSFTNSGGQAKVGLLLSLLRDRDIDDERFAIADASLALTEADLALIVQRIDVQQNAAIRYWQWVAAGLRLAIYRDLLDIAVIRDGNVQKQVSRGAMAAINLVENQTIITRRQSLIASAEREFAIAATRLGLFYRDEDGKVQGVEDAQLPSKEKISDPAAIYDTTPSDDPRRLIETRPEILALQTKIQRTLNRVRLRENAIKPKLDVSLEVSDGLGGIAEGGPSRDTTDTVVGLSFSVPLQRRAARARLAQSRLQLEALNAQRDELSDVLAQEILELDIQRRFALDLAKLAETEVELLTTLQEAEQKRIQQGDSDFFLVNVREQNVANARINALTAWLQVRLAEVRYQAVTLDFERLGLTGI